MTLREQMEAALDGFDEIDMLDSDGVLDALLPVVEAAVAAERDVLATIDKAMGEG
jgi:hypothetical protein